MWWMALKKVNEIQKKTMINEKFFNSLARPHTQFRHIFKYRN